MTSLWFVAFEGLGETIAKNARKGDQLILQAQIRSNNWTDKEGEKQYDHSFVVQNFRFGAPGKIKREELRRGATRGRERSKPKSEGNRIAGNRLPYSCQLGKGIPPCITPASIASLRSICCRC